MQLHNFQLLKDPDVWTQTVSLVAMSQAKPDQSQALDQPEVASYDVSFHSLASKCGIPFFCEHREGHMILPCATHAAIT